MKVNLTQKAKSLSGELIKLQAQHAQLTDGSFVQIEQEVTLKDIFLAALSGSNLQKTSEIKAAAGLAQKANGEDEFEATEDEFKLMLYIFKLQRFYLLHAFLKMLEELNPGFKLEDIEK